MVWKHATTPPLNSTATPLPFPNNPHALPSYPRLTPRFYFLYTLGSVTSHKHDVVCLLGPFLATPNIVFSVRSSQSQAFSYKPYWKDSSSQAEMGNGVQRNSCIC